MERKGIAVAGTTLIDKVYGIAAYPAEGELTHIRSIDMAFGGIVPNTGVGLKVLRPELDVYGITRLGEDAEGHIIENFLKSKGLDTTGITFAEGEKSAFTDVMSIVGGQRTFFTYPGATAKFGCDDIPWDTLNVKMLHLGYFLLLDAVDNGEGYKILKKASEMGIKTSIDVVSENSDRYKIIVPCLPFVDYLIINETESARITDMSPDEDNLVNVAKKLLDMGVRECVIIHTPTYGVIVRKDGAVTELAPWKKPEGFIKGTVGAGDAYCAGALVGIYEGRDDRTILEYATLAAASSLRAPDATSGMDTLDALYKEFGDKVR